MKPELFAQVRSLFEAVCDLPEAEQEARLLASDHDSQVLDEVRRLLRADRDDRLQTSVVAQVPDLVDGEQCTPLRDGQMLGSWRIIGVIGQGGMGAVYLAERADGTYQQKVAIKFIAADSGHWREDRFNLERQILALLKHPNIAQLIDAGADENGYPYFVMEYVEGQTLDHFIADQQVNKLGVVKLMLAACRAIAYAHQQQILHRDIKPANLIVSHEGVLKVLDFGIAKVVDGKEDHSAPATMVATVRYAAPEQLRGDTVTPASDVFSLAVVLVELLVGRHPFVKNESASLSEQLLTGRADRLSRMLKAHPGELGLTRSQLNDLDTVLAKALDADPSERYSNASEFADDLQRCLDGQPVKARRHTFSYLLRAWMRRHVVASVALVVALMSLVIGAALATWQAVEAQAARDEALLGQAKAERINEFLTKVFTISRPSESRGNEVTARELLDQAATEVDDLTQEPAIQVEMYGVLAGTYRLLGLYSEAERLNRRAVERAEAVFGDSALETANALADLAWIHLYQSRAADAVPLFERAIDVALQHPEETSTLAKLYTRKSTAHISLNQKDEANASLERGISLLRAQEPPDWQRLASALRQRATIAVQADQLELADSLFNESLDANVAAYGAEHQSVALMHHNLAALRYKQKRYDEAIEHFSTSVRINRKVFGVDNAHVANALAGLGLSYRNRGDAELARKALAESLDAYVAWQGEEHVTTAYARSKLADIEYLIGDKSRAAEVYAGALLFIRQAYPDLSSTIRCSIERVGLQIGSYPGPLPEQVDTVRTCIAETWPPDSVYVARALHSIAEATGLPADRQAALTYIDAIGGDALLASVVKRD